jgi:hypothetical protein
MFGENGFCDHGADPAWPTNARTVVMTWTNRMSRSRMPDFNSGQNPLDFDAI